MDFDKYVEGNILSLISCSTTMNISELVSFLQNKPNIANLNLSGDNIDDQDITELTKLKNLASFTLSKTYISGERAKELAQFTDSTSLTLAYNDISNEGAQELAKLKNISILIGNTASAEGVKQLDKLKNTGAYVDNNIISAVDTKESAELRNTDTCMNNTESAKESAKPTSMGFDRYIRNNILSIQLCSTINISELVSFLQNKPGITSLNLADCSICNKGAKELAKLKNLTSLTLVCNNISDEGAKALANLTNLTSLDLFDNSIDDEGAKELAKLTNLTYLDLSENIIGDEGIKELAKLTKLTYLSLADCYIGDEGAKALVSLEKLTCLELANNYISYQVAEELSNKLVNLDTFDLLANNPNNENVKKQSVEHATQTPEVDDLLSISSNICSKDTKNKPFPENVTDQLATVSNCKHSKTPSNVGCNPVTDNPNSNHVPAPILKQEHDSDKQLSNPKRSGNILNSAQKSRLPVITVSILTVAGVVLGIAIAVYLEMLAVGIAVGTCCLVAAGIVYYYNKPASLLKGNDVQEFLQDVQELTC